MSKNRIREFLMEADRLERSGDLSAAADAVARSLELAPEEDEVRRYLAKLLMVAGRDVEAHAHYRHFHDRGDEDLDLPVHLLDTLKTQTARAGEPALEDDIRLCLGFPNVNPALLTRLVCAHLRAKHPGIPAKQPPAVDTLCADDFLVLCLSRMPLADPAIEKSLRGLRLALSSELISDGQLRADRLDMMTALAQQADLNQYVWSLEPVETKLIASLRELLQKMLGGEAAQQGLLGYLLVAAMYMPLYDAPESQRLLDIPLADWPGPIGDLLKSTLHDRHRERELAATVPTLRPITDETSRRVQAQYEDFPYPRWTAISHKTPIDFREDLRIRLQGADLPVRLDRENLSMLVAGSGTGSQPLSIALTYRGARITAVDLSDMSLAYAMRKAQEMGIEGIDFQRGDILELADAGRRWDVIFCSGVLHHMADPVAGWRVLCEVLEPGGVMCIGLYSERARAAIVRAREFIARHGYGDDADSIRTFRRDVLDGRFGDALAPLLNIGDFYHLSGCRDLVFNVQEHRYDLLEIDAIRRELGLEVLGFNQIMPGFKQLYRKTFPDDPTMTDLANWDRLEREHPGMFLNMYNLWFRHPLS